MARIPNPAATERNLPQAGARGGAQFPDAGRSLTNRVVSEAASDAGKGLSAASDQLAKYGQHLQRGQDRIKTREEATKRIIARNRFDQEMQDELRKLISGDGDSEVLQGVDRSEWEDPDDVELSNPKVAEAFNLYSRSKMDGFIERHSGSEESRLSLRADLDTLFSKYRGMAAGAAVEASKKKVDFIFKQEVEARNAQITTDPNSFRGILEDNIAMIDEIDPTFTDAEVQAKRQYIFDTAATEFANKMINAGQIDDDPRTGAIGLETIFLNTPGLVEGMSGGVRRQIQANIAAYRKGKRNHNPWGANVNGVPVPIFEKLPKSMQDKVVAGSFPKEQSEQLIMGLPRSWIMPVLKEHPRLASLMIGKALGIEGVQVVEGEDGSHRLEFKWDAVTANMTTEGSPAVASTRQGEADIAYLTEMLGHAPSEDFVKSWLVKGGTTVNINDTKEKAFFASLGQGEAKVVMKAYEDAQLATVSRTHYEFFRKALQSGNFETGSFSDLRTSVARISRFFGVDPNRISALQVLKVGSAEYADAFETLTANMAVAFAQKLSRVTNLVMKFSENAVPNAMKTPEGNLLILSIFDRMAKRDQDLYALQRQYAERNGGLSPKDPSERFWHEIVNDYDKNNPILDDDIQAQMIEYGGTPDQPKPVSGFQDFFPTEDGTPTTRTIRELPENEHMNPGERFEKIVGDEIFVWIKRNGKDVLVARDRKKK